MTEELRNFLQMKIGDSGDSIVVGSLNYGENTILDGVVNKLLTDPTFQDIVVELRNKRSSQSNLNVDDPELSKYWFSDEAIAVSLITFVNPSLLEFSRKRGDEVIKAVNNSARSLGLLK